MTVLLILFTLIFFLIADFFVQRVRPAKVPAVAAPSGRVPAMPADAALMVNHTWVRREHDGAYVIGVDDLLNRIAGAMERIVLPAPGCVLAEGDPGIHLGAGGRAIAIESPVAGNVVEINRSVLADPRLAHNDPYGAGWLMKVRPSAHGEGISGALSVSSPAEWLREQGDLMREFFLGEMASLQGATLPDGGVPVNGVLQLHDAGVWKRFNRSFAALPEPVTVGAGKEQRS